MQQGYRPPHSGEEQGPRRPESADAHAALFAEIMPLPKNGKDRGTSARFSKQSDGWRTSNRYRQMPIPVREGGQADIQIGALEYIAAS